MRANTDITVKDRKQYEMTGFRGVDFSSDKMHISPKRASWMRNLVCVSGVNRKRNGWCELLKLNGRINGIFPFEDHLLVHAGESFYKVTHSNGTYSSAKVNALDAEGFEVWISNTKSQAFYRDNKMFIIGCGDFLVWDGASLVSVYDGPGTYIPTTTISIDADAVSDANRATLDDVNLMTGWRKNSMIGSSELTASDKVWTVDTGKIGHLDSNGNVDDTQGCPKVSVLITTMVKVNVNDSDVPADILLEATEFEVINNDGTPIVTHNAKLKFVEAKRIIRTKGTIKETLADGTTKEKETYSKLGYGTINLFSVGTELGYVDFDTGKIHIGQTIDGAEVDVPVSPLVLGEDNIEVTFYYSNANAEKCPISGCQFGVLFGVNGGSDTLFLSGNASYPNVDYHSAPEDFSYFPDRNTTVYGSASVPVVGYGRISDATLAVYKQENTKESTIYYRTGDFKTVGENLFEIYPVVAGSIGKGVASRFGCVNFAGDPLIVSKDGVYGIVLGENITSSERYARPRSVTINERLRQKSLSDAAGIVFGDRYYLAVDGECYVADAGYTFTHESGYAYEWWFWDDVPAVTWAVVNDCLWFGTADGMICRFDDEYTDRTFAVTPAASLAIDGCNITYQAGLSVSEGDEVVIGGSGLYAKYAGASSFTVADGCVSVSEDIMHLIHEGDEVYADNVSGTGLSVNTKYTVCNVDRGECTFSLMAGEDAVSLSSGGFGLFKDCTGKKLTVRDLDRENSVFCLCEYPGGPALCFSTYNNGSFPNAPSSTFFYKKPIVSEWYTPVMDLGTNMSSKTLLRMSVATVPGTSGKCKFGYETRDLLRLSEVSFGTSFSLGHLSFEDFSFDTGFATSYTRRCNARNFNFIMFRFISEDGDIAVSSFSISYKINKQNRGVR